MLLQDTPGELRKIQRVTLFKAANTELEYNTVRVPEAVQSLTFKRRIKSHLPFAGIIRSSPYSTRFQDKG